MADTDLLFRRTPVATPGPVHLVFGEDVAVVYEATLSAVLPGPTLSARLVRPNDATLAATLPGPTFSAQGNWLPSIIYEATLSASLPGLTLSARLVRPNDATLAVTLPGLRLEAVGAFASNTERPVVGHSAHRHQDGAALTAGRSQASGRGQSPPSGTEARHEVATPLGGGVAAAHQAGAGVAQGTGTRHTEADPLRAGMRHAHGTMLRGSRPSVRTGHTEADPLRTSAMSSHQERYRDRRPAVGTRHTEADPLRASVRSGAGAGRSLGLRRRTRHQEAMRPPAGRYAPPGVVPPFDPCYLPDPHLLFVEARATDGALLFRCERHGLPPVATLVIPIRSLYMVTNNLSLTRVLDGAVVPSNSARIAVDVESWTWSFSAELPGSALPLVDAEPGDPTELLLSINGMPFRVMAESLRRSRRFGSSELTISGRGRSAALGAPFAAERSFSAATARTAQQLAEEALLINGVPSGWNLDWRLTDWLVPGGAWVRTGTPIDAIQAIAAAAGGYVQPHPTSQTLLILPRYAELPRDWAALTPDLELPAAVVTVEGIEWINRPAYNRVFLAGGAMGGILGDVRLDGSAGDLAAPMVQDALITDAAAARQRGRAILGDTGRQARVTLRVPALTELGLVSPGKLLRYADGQITRLGLVRSVQLEASHAQAWQTMGVETHV